MLLRQRPTLLEVLNRPVCHYMMGGIHTNKYGQVLTIGGRGRDVIVEGLYAAGECASVSVHGANRLGANSLLEIVVFGRAVGHHINDQLAQGAFAGDSLEKESIERATSRLNFWRTQRDGESIDEISREMKKIMQEDFGVFRDGEHMADGLARLETVRARLAHASIGDHSLAFNTRLITALELDNMMAVAYASAVGAQERLESRGAHSRIDYPDRDDKNWHKHSLHFEDGKKAYRKVNMAPEHGEAFPLEEREH
jgi:succinate dehydrogenase / fumarate reductase flavoprotein subunit